MRESQHISICIERPAAEVYAYVANPVNLPNWAAGLSGSIEQRDGRWVAEAPMGESEVVFVPDNPDIGLAHRVTLSDGTSFNKPMRVIAHAAGCELVLTLRSKAERSEDDYQ